MKNINQCVHCEHEIAQTANHCPSCNGYQSDNWMFNFFDKGIGSYNFWEWLFFIIMNGVVTALIFLIIWGVKNS